MTVCVCVDGQMRAQIVINWFEYSSYLERLYISRVHLPFLQFLGLREDSVHNLQSCFE